MPSALVARVGSNIYCSRPAEDDRERTSGLLFLTSMGADSRDMEDVFLGMAERAEHYLITPTGEMVGGPFTFSEVAQAKSEALANWPTVDVYYVLANSYNDVFGR